MLCKMIFVWILVGFAFVENKPPRSSGTDSFHPQEKSVSAAKSSSKMIRCLRDCGFEFSSNDSLVIPSKCKSYVQSKTCVMNLGMDYIQNTGLVNFDSDNMTDVVFDASLKAIVRLSYKQHADKDVTWRYVCTNDDECTSDYFNKYASYYLELTKQVQSLYFHLSTFLYSNVSSSSVQQCYQDPNKTIECQNGICEYMWDEIANGTGSYVCNARETLPDIIYHINETSSMNIITKTIREVVFTCNRDRCNSPGNVIAIRKAIEDNWVGVLDTNSAAQSIAIISIYLLIVHFIIVF